MGLADALEKNKRPPKRSGGTCSIARIMGKLNETDRAALIAALAEPTEDRSNDSIAESLQEEGFDVQAQSVLRHRRKRCRCEL